MHLTNYLLLPAILLSTVLAIPQASQLQEKEPESKPLPRPNHPSIPSNATLNANGTLVVMAAQPDFDILRTCTDSSFSTTKGGKCIVWKASDAKKGKNGCVNLRIVDANGNPKAEDMNDKVSSIQTFQFTCDLFK
jgi:hypothetical protein